jgi:hypothetical protein
MGITPSGDVVFFRRKFTVPTGQCAYQLTVKADNSAEIYINGNLVGSTSNNWQTGTTFNVPASFLLVGSNKNTIAVKSTDDGTTGWMSLVLCRICL